MMVAKINGYPTKDELRARIENQLSWHEKSETVGLLWRGYLAGLFEWGLIELDCYTALCALLPDVGGKELYELFGDEPISLEKEAEIEEYLRSKAQRKDVL
jgi:hypothetical protein